MVPQNPSPRPNPLIFHILHHVEPLSNFSPHSPPLFQSHPLRLAVHQVDLRDRCVAGMKSRYTRESRRGSNGRPGSVWDCFMVGRLWQRLWHDLHSPKVVRYVARVTLHTTKVGEWTEKSMAPSSPPRLRFSTFVSRLISRREGTAPLRFAVSWAHFRNKILSRKRWWQIIVLYGEIILFKLWGINYFRPWVILHPRKK